MNPLSIHAILNIMTFPFTIVNNQIFITIIPKYIKKGSAANCNNNFFPDNHVEKYFGVNQRSAVLYAYHPLLELFAS